MYVPLMVSLLSSSTRLMSWSNPFSMPLTGGREGGKERCEGWMMEENRKASKHLLQGRYVRKKDRRSARAGIPSVRLSYRHTPAHEMTSPFLISSMRSLSPTTTQRRMTLALHVRPHTYTQPPTPLPYTHTFPSTLATYTITHTCIHVSPPL